MLDMTYRMFGGRDKAAGLLKKFIPMYLPAAEKYAPEIIEEMKGMAAGAKADFQDILFLNITYEISTPSVMGCTSFAATGDASPAVVLLPARISIILNHGNNLFLF